MEGHATGCSQGCRVFTWDPKTRLMSDMTQTVYESPVLNEPPATFRRMARNVEEMSTARGAAVRGDDPQGGAARTARR